MSILSIPMHVWACGKDHGTYMLGGQYAKARVICPCGVETKEVDMIGEQRDDVQVWPPTEEGKIAEGLLKAAERAANKEPWLANRIVPTHETRGGQVWVPKEEFDIQHQGVQALTERCAQRQQAISELQAEIMEKDALIANLYEQVKRGDELNAAQSEKIRFWTQSHGELEAGLEAAQQALHETREKGLKIEGERIALEMVNTALLDRIVEIASNNNKGE